MAVQITYFVHGTTEDNEKGLSSGWNDAQLSELGIKQSKELTAKTTHLNFDAVENNTMQIAERIIKTVKDNQN